MSYNVLVDVSVIKETTDWLVLNKPAGVVVNRSQTIREATIQDWLYDQYGKQWKEAGYFADETFANRLGVAHRLDRETSGCLLVAKNPETLQEFLRQFKEREIEKEYVAMVRGVMPSRVGRIEVPLARHVRERHKFTANSEGREAVTDFTVEKVEERNGKTYSWLRLRPKTGRTHQIRVHLQYLHHPVVGDLTYGGREAREERDWCGPRHLLHAEKISFVVDGKKHTIASPLPFKHGN